MKLTTIRLFADDIDRCAAFYKEHFGFEERANAGVYIELETGECKLGFYRRDLMGDVLGGRLEAGAGDSFLINIETGSVDDAVSKLREQGVEIVVEPQDQPDWFMRIAHVRDPEGNLIELYHSTHVPG